MNHFMIKHTLAILALCVSTSVWGQTVLSDFSVAPALFSGSWGSNNTLSSGLLTIGGSALTDGSFYYNNGGADWSGFTALQITARRDAGNAATTFNFYADTDFGFTSFTTSVSTSLFGSSLTTVTIPFALPEGFNPAVDFWGITTEAAGADNFRMTFDSISLTAVPEPSTYAAILGLATLGFVGVRRFRRR